MGFNSAFKGLSNTPLNRSS